jgi:Fic family protein
MGWNWEQADWPNFSWNSARFEKVEQMFLVQAGVYVGTVGHLEDEVREQVTIEALSQEALTTSEIEGELLSRASIQSSIRRQFGLTTDSRRVPAAEFGISEMMVNVYRSFDRPLTAETLFEWHRMLVNGRRDLRDIGRYRTDSEPMQIVSGPLHAPRVHFEAPPSPQVPAEMSRFIDWFNSTSPSGSAALPPVQRAGVAHLYFESIHPFEDGNGRIGRAISEKALAGGLGQPALTALATAILGKRRAYSEALDAAIRSNCITDWLAWFGAVVIEAQRKTIAQVELTLEKARLFERLADEINERQKKVLLRVFREGPAGFKGGLSAGNYRQITGVAPATVTRDLVGLVAMGALYKTGENRSARYFPKIATAPVSPVVVAENGELL